MILAVFSEELPPLNAVSSILLNRHLDVYKRQVISYKYGSGDKPQLKTVFKSSIFLIAAGSLITFAVSQLSVGFVLDVFTGSTSSGVKNVTLEGFGIYLSLIHI